LNLTLNDRPDSCVDSRMFRWVAVLLLVGTAHADSLKATQLSVGGGHVCALVKSEVVCWGDNAVGQLGVGVSGKAVGELTKPHVVGGLPKIVRVSAGQQHTCAIDVDGAVWCWGSAGGDVVVTDGGTTGSMELKGDKLGTPVKMPLGKGKARAIHVSNAGPDACAAFEDEVRCWSTFRAIPINATSIAKIETKTYTISAVTKLAMSHGKICAINVAGLSCWTHDQKPAAAKLDQLPATVAMGEMYACVASAKGDARCWWSLVDEFWKRKPDREIQWKAKRATRAIAVGDSPVCTVDATGAVDCFLSDEGGLTDDAIAASWATTQLAPHKIPGVSDAVDIGIARGRDVFGYGFGCALGKSGDVFCWGDNETGQLGRGDTERSKTAARVLAPVRD